MAHYGLLCREAAGIPIVLREHNIESVIMGRYSEFVRSWFFRLWLAIQKKRICAYEAWHATQFDACCAISEEDRQRLLVLGARDNIRVIPGGIDARYFSKGMVRDKIPFSMSFFGSLDWIPNQDALQWFIQEILPKIVEKYPKAKLFVVGKNLTGKMRMIKPDNVVIRGFVPDVLDELDQYLMTVVPIRIGGGMRLKILESFAMGLPVVSTSVGCEGIDGHHDEHLLIADSAEQFALQVLRLFEDETLGRTLAENAFELANRKYRWESIAEEFEKTYMDVIRRTGERSQGC